MFAKSAAPALRPGAKEPDNKRLGASVTARLAVISGCICAAACAKPASPPQTLTAEQRFDAARERLTQALDEASPCYRNETTSNGVQIMRSLPPGDCMDMTPARVMRGVWFIGFEESGFVPDIDAVPLTREISRESVPPEFEIELNGDREEALRRMGVQEVVGTQAYAITFVGRRSRPYRYAGGGAGFPVVVVDALLTGRPLGRVTTTMVYPCPGSRCGQREASR
jgi:hypothetical protein